MSEFINNYPEGERNIYHGYPIVADADKGSGETIHPLGEVLNEENPEIEDVSDKLPEDIKDRGTVIITHKITSGTLEGLYVGEVLDGLPNRLVLLEPEQVVDRD